MKGHAVQVRKQQREYIIRAYDCLVMARNLLASAECPKALARVRLAISSCKGAVRNSGTRIYRAQREERKIVANVTKFLEVKL